MARMKDMLLEGQRLGIDMTQPDALERTLVALEYEETVANAHRSIEEAAQKAGLGDDEVNAALADYAISMLPFGALDTVLRLAEERMGAEEVVA